jgi:hypothetical protein
MRPRRAWTRASLRLLTGLLAAFVVACAVWARRLERYERLAQLHESEEAIQIAERWLLASGLLPGRDANEATREMLEANGVGLNEMRAFAYICDLIAYHSSMKRKYREAGRYPWSTAALDPPQPEEAGF